MLIHEVVLVNYFLRDQSGCNLVVLILRHRVFEVNFLTPTTRYLEPGVERAMFQCILEVVRLGVGVSTGMKKLILYTTNVIFTLCVSFYRYRCHRLCDSM